MAEYNRKRNHLEYFDYSNEGIYFITVCTKNKQCILSRIERDAHVRDSVLDVPIMKLTEFGSIVDTTINSINRTYEHIDIEHYVIMPNHIHMLIHILENDHKASRANERIPALISTLKRFTNKKCGCQIWHRSYHDHIIRGEQDYRKIWNYIDSNPEKWGLDCYYRSE